MNEPTGPASPQPAEEAQKGAPDKSEVSLPPWAAKVFAWAWNAVAHTNVGFFTLIALIYVIPYGLAIAALTTQAVSGGDFVILGGAALIAASYAASQPAPTPGLGTVSLVLAGVLGANFDPLIVGLVAAVAQTLGLATSYGAGAAGLAPVITARFESNRAVTAAISRAAGVIRRRGATAMLLLASVPNPLYAWASVFAGASETPFSKFTGASFLGGAARFLVCAYLGNEILNYL